MKKKDTLTKSFVHVAPELSSSLKVPYVANNWISIVFLILDDMECEWVKEYKIVENFLNIEN